MRYDEPFVGTLSIVIAVIAFAIAVGPWTEPYRLRTIAAISRRYGKPAARGVWVAIAITCLTTGLAILSGMRPTYALPPARADVRE